MAAARHPATTIRLIALPPFVARPRHALVHPCRAVGCNAYFLSGCRDHSALTRWGRSDTRNVVFSDSTRSHLGYPVVSHERGTHADAANPAIRSPDGGLLLRRAQRLLQRLRQPDFDLPVLLADLQPGLGERGRRAADPPVADGELRAVPRARHHVAVEGSLVEWSPRVRARVDDRVESGRLPDHQHGQAVRVHALHLSLREVL